LPSGRAWARLVLACLTVAALLVVPTAASAATHHTLTVTVTGGGAVSIGSRGTTCNSQCAVSEPAGQLVTMTAVAPPGSTFTGWRGACYGSAPICATLPNADTSVVAHFSSAGQIDMTVSGPGVVSSAPAGLSCGGTHPLCDATFPDTSPFELTATPNSGAQFTGWGGPCAQYGTLPCAVEVSGTAGVTASFATDGQSAGQASLTVNHPRLTVLSAPDVMDSCGDRGVCTTSVASGTSVTLSASDAFALANPLTIPTVNWSGACVGVWPVCSLVVDASTSVTVAQPQTTTVPGAAGASTQAHDLFTMTVSGPGRVRVDGYTTKCPSNCRWNLPDGDKVRIVAVSTGKHAQFFKWQGFCSGRRDSCPVKIGPGESAEAVFRR
jgi:Divergent InlB B-repeat domain